MVVAAASAWCFTLQLPLPSELHRQSQAQSARALHSLHGWQSATQHAEDRTGRSGRRGGGKKRTVEEQTKKKKEVDDQRGDGGSGEGWDGFVSGGWG